MGIGNILRPTKRWPDYIADVERVIMSKPATERDRIFELFRGLGGLLMGLPDDVGSVLYDAIIVTAVKVGPGHNIEDLWPRAAAAAPNLVAAIRSFADETQRRAT